MIPSGGRDVQCSSCGHTWFQRPDEAEDALADELGVTERDTSYDAPEPDRSPDPTAGRAPEPMPPPAATSIASASAAPKTAPDPAPKPRTVDDAAREILREEARREAAARRRDQGSLESQPDLGLEESRDADNRAAAARARLARLRQPQPGDDEDSVESASEIAATVSNASRRELLPDIEEINSTLTATSDRQGEIADPVVEVQQAEARRGFRSGFIAIFAVVAVLAIIYLMAPRIAESIPATAPALATYLDWANGMLDALDVGLRKVVDGLNGMMKGDSA